MLPLVSMIMKGLISRRSTAGVIFFKDASLVKPEMPNASPKVVMPEAFRKSRRDVCIFFNVFKANVD